MPATGNRGATMLAPGPRSTSTQGGSSDG
jgi:hypothetical protein